MEYNFTQQQKEDITTAEWHKERGPAHHLEQDLHALRMYTAGGFVRFAHKIYKITSVNDLGAGDGGMLSSLKDMGIPLWGCDLSPKNVDFAQQSRGVNVQYVDFIREPEKVPEASLTIMTEMIEHLADPHGFLAGYDKSEWIVASSPAFETDKNHYEFHLWAWDQQGYVDLFVKNGWDIIQKGQVGFFQILLAHKRK